MSGHFESLKHDLESIKINIVNWKNNIAKSKKLQSYTATRSKKLYNVFDLLKSRLSYSSMPGQEPFTRGAYSSMYTNKVWTIRQYAGFGTSEDTNIFYHDCLKQGQKGLSIAFDLPTHRGIDSDNILGKGDIGKAGVAIDSVEDMKVLLHNIPLDEISVSMTMNGAVLPILASYIVAAEEMGFKKSTLTGTIQNDILKEFIVRNTYIYPPEPSMRIIGDIISYLSTNVPKFHPISISGYHFQETGASPSLELGLALANGIEYVKCALDRGLSVDVFAPRLSFFFAVGMDFFQEIAKLRAARWLWSDLLASFEPKKTTSKILKMHCQTSGWSLSPIDPLNNIVRTTVEAMAAILGGTQSLHTNSFDEALALPSEESARIARNTQLILQHETNIPKIIDPLGGAYYIEALTRKIYKNALFFIDKIKNNGGVIKSIDMGLQKRWILQEAIKKQALIDAEEIKIIGRNDKNVNQNIEDSLRHIDSQLITATQKKHLYQLKKNRNNVRVNNILNTIKEKAKGHSNLLSLSIQAMKARVSVGELSNVLAESFGKYSINSFSISNVYKANFIIKKDFRSISKKIKRLSNILGRPPRILMTKIGQDGHDRGLICIASGLADLGFDVDLLPLFPTINHIVKCALDNNVHIIGVSSMTGGHMELLPALYTKLQEDNLSNIKIIMGSIIQKNEYKFLYNTGVKLIFNPSHKILNIADDIVKLLSDNYNENI